MPIDDQYLVPALAFGLGVILYLAAPRLIAITRDDDYGRIEIRLLRAALAIFLVLQVLDVILHSTMQTYYNRLMLKISGSILVLVLGVLAFNYANRLFLDRFGISQNFDGEQSTTTSYHSRMASLIFLSFLIVLAGYAIIEIWGMEELTQKTGFIGLVAAFLVLSNPIWLPELFHGVTLLGSSMSEEGDTIAVAGEPHLYIIDRLTPFYALLLDVHDNQKMIVKNSDLMKGRIYNLTKSASEQGVHKRLEFGLRHPDHRADKTAVAAIFARLDQSVAAVFKRAVKDDRIPINEEIPFTWAMVGSDDSALRLKMSYYLQPLPETKKTARILSHVVGSEYRLLKLLYEEAAAHGLTLATPSLLKIEMDHTETRGPGASQGADSHAGLPPGISGRK